MAILATEARIGREYVFASNRGQSIDCGEPCILRAVSDQSADSGRDIIPYFVQSKAEPARWCWAGLGDLVALPPGDRHADIPGLVRRLGDHAEENGWPDGGRVGMDAAAEVERAAEEHAEMLRLIRIVAQRTPLVGGLFESRGCAICGIDQMDDEHSATCGIGALLARIDGR